MTVHECLRKVGWETDCDVLTGARSMVVDINFLNNNKVEDETEFLISAYDANELSELFSNFCKENGFSKNSVLHCVVVAMAATREELENR